MYVDENWRIRQEKILKYTEYTFRKPVKFSVAVVFFTVVWHYVQGVFLKRNPSLKYYKSVYNIAYKYCKLVALISSFCCLTAGVNCCIIFIYTDASQNLALLLKAQTWFSNTFSKNVCC